jgi:His Kinase A (phosphoacceptor) domain./Histidine kinase-, DNA gyrase B-, and HSP90-like ATPase.
MSPKRIFSLRYKQLIVILLGMFFSFGLLLLTQSLGEALIKKYYLNKYVASQRLDNYHESLRDYVNKNNLSIQNVSAISKWVKYQKDVYLIIYKGEHIFYESGYWNNKKTSKKLLELMDANSSSALLEWETEDINYDSYYDQSNKNIKFYDGNYSATIIDFSSSKWYSTTALISWCVFFLCLFTIQMLYNHHIITRILHLSKEVSSIEKGRLEQTISHNGNDEIALLALNADNMRASILTRLESEKEAWEANSELITSMSHDIRTPLTSLIGYLEILESKDYRSQEQFDKYIKNSKEKSLQLKELSDKLFQYFLVFGKEHIEMELETFDVNILFQQLLYEHVFDLKNSGFMVETAFTEEACIITADIQYLKRLFNNIFSNIEKYADPNGQVQVIGTIQNHTLHIRISNEIRTDRVLVESTHIGLKTCQKIVEQMGGSFQSRNNSSHFEVSIAFSIKPKEGSLNL